MPTTDKQALIEQIRFAEEALVSVGGVIDSRREELDDWLGRQGRVRARLQSLRKQLIELEREVA